MDIKDNIYDILREKGDRLTRQKKDIISVLLANMDRMLSVGDMVGCLVDGKNVDEATVYRNVLRLAELGILETMVDDKGINRYIIEHGSRHHHHMICISCGKVLKIPCKNNYWNAYAKENNFEEMYHKLEVYGICEQCKNIKKDY